MKRIRHYQRYAVSGHGFIYRNHLQRVGFTVNDISASGMNITSDTELAEHEVLSMDIEISGKLLPFTKQLKGKVIRKRQHNSIFHYGIRFIERTHKDMVEADEYLRLNFGIAALYFTNETGEDENSLKQFVYTEDA